MKWLTYLGIFLLLVLLICLCRVWFCRSKSSSMSTAPSGEPPSSTPLQPPNSNPHYVYVPAPAGHQGMAPGGAIWVPEPNSTWQPASSHQASWSGQNQSSQGWTEQGFPRAPSMAQFCDLPPSYDEAIVAKPQDHGVEYKEGLK